MGVGQNMFSEQKTFNEYINIAKRTTYIFCIITIFMFFIVLYIGIRLDNYILFIFEMIMIIVSVNKIRKYSKMKKIEKYLIKQNLIDKIGNINFINENHYIFTDYYIIVLYKQNVKCFDYFEIKKVYKEYWNKFDISTANFGNYVELYLNFILKNGMKFRILTDTFTHIILEDDGNYQEIINYLLMKNAEIEIGDECLKNKLCIK